ncbi:MAG: DUF1648 domain-containing protein [archaeon]
MGKKDWIALAVIAVTFLAGAFLYPSLPERMASHWNAAGEVDGYMPRFWGTFLLPLVNLGVLGLFMLIPKIMVYKENFKKFEGEYMRFRLVMILFMAYIYALALFANLGRSFSMNFAMAPALLALLYFAGELCINSRRNYFIGMRTPWALADEGVWKRTNKVGGRLLQLTGVVLLFALWLKAHAALIIVGYIIFFLIYVMAYSYLEYKKLRK